VAKPIEFPLFINYW